VIANAVIGATMVDPEIGHADHQRSEGEQHPEKECAKENGIKGIVDRKHRCLPPIQEQPDHCR
jgi:hypothetical protein